MSKLSDDYEAARKAHDEWVTAISWQRPHAVINALWEVVRLTAERIGTVPGVRP